VPKDCRRCLAAFLLVRKLFTLRTRETKMAIDTTSLENEIKVFDSFRVAAIELGLSGAALKLTEEVLSRKELIIKLNQVKK
jgi:hypothetical protein